MFANISVSISWYKARNNLFRLQRRILKAFLVGDFASVLRLQKILVLSNSSRLLAIRKVTQFQNKISNSLSYDKLNLTYGDRFNLSNYLLGHFTDWIPQKSKVFQFYTSSSKLGLKKFKLWSLSDRCWQCIVKFAIEPIYEISFSPRNFGFRNASMEHYAQKVIFLNLSKSSCGSQKRLLFVSLKGIFDYFDLSFLLRKILCPRFIKLGLFRFFNLGFIPAFDSDVVDFDFLVNLLANIALSELDLFLNSLRYGYDLLFFLRPLDNELFLMNQLYIYFDLLGIKKVWF